MFKEIGAVVAAERIRQKRRVADLGAYDAGLLTDGEARSLLGLERLGPLPWERFRVVGRSTSAAFAP
jgi:hypothetical protein